MKLTDENGNEYELVETKVNLRRGDVVVRPLKAEKQAYWLDFVTTLRVKCTPQTAQALAEALKAVLEFVQMPMKDDSHEEQYDKWHEMDELIKSARSSYQSDREEE